MREWVCTGALVDRECRDAGCGRPSGDLARIGDQDVEAVEQEGDGFLVGWESQDDGEVLRNSREAFDIAGDYWGVVRIMNKCS